MEHAETDRSEERWTISARRFRQIGIVTVVLLCVVVVSGGAVRLTGSGLGCDDWPNCNDTSFIDVSDAHAAIEQLNRLFSALIGIPVLAMALLAGRVRPRRSGLVGPSIGVLVTVLGNGILGGLTVLGDLHPVLVQSHFLLTMASIAFALVAIRRAGTRADDSVSRPALRWWFWAVGVLTAAGLVTGTVVTGTGPHAGEEDVRRFGFDISNVARTHSLTVIAAAIAVVGLVIALGRAGQRSRFENVLSTWMFVAVVQGGIGYVQYFNGVPEILVGAHLAGATLLWVITVQLLLDGLGNGASLPVEPVPTVGGADDLVGTSV